MNVHELVSELIINTKDVSLGLFLPELCLCITIVLMLLVRLLPGGARVNTFYLAMAGSLVAFFLAAPWQLLGEEVPARQEIFTGMLVYDPFTVFMRGVLTGFLVLFALLTRLSGIPDREDGPDIYTLVFGATLGMCLMSSANHLMMVFMAVEMASVPSFVLAGLLKGRKLGSEAALKYSVFGAGAAGVMLYGISLIAGLLNSAHLPTLAMRLAEGMPQFSTSGEAMVLALGGLMLMVGLAFKLSAVPFHFWCPDVFEGASAEVNAFLSVASKAAALALLVRVAIGFGIVPTGSGAEEGLAAKGNVDGSQQLVSAAGDTTPVMALQEDGEAVEADEQEGEEAAAAADATPSVRERLALPRNFIGKLVAFFAVITCTFGNLAAYAQTNIKRLLAYSTIAHAGYMMMAVPALMVLVGLDVGGAESAVGGLAVYIGVYLFMNLAAFAIVAFLRNAMHTEEIEDYAGLIRHCPITVICLSLTLFGLVGLPPLSGFLGKFAIFASLVDGYQASLAIGTPATYLMVVLVAGGVNTALSLFYYLRVVKVMTMDPEPEDRRPFVYSEVSLQSAYVLLLTAPTALLIFNWDGLNRIAQAAASHLLG